VIAKFSNPISNIHIPPFKAEITSDAVFPGTPFLLAAEFCHAFVQTADIKKAAPKGGFVRSEIN
jgi:hypothetical protein